MHNYTTDVATYVRAGALVPPPQCPGGGITRVGPGQYTQYTRADFGHEAVGSSLRLRQDRRRAQQSYGTLKSRMVAEPWLQTHGEQEPNPHPDVVSGQWKFSAPQSVNESVTYFEEHPELMFDGNNNKRAVVSAFKYPDSWLKSLRYQKKEAGVVWRRE